VFQALGNTTTPWDDELMRQSATEDANKLGIIDTTINVNIRDLTAVALSEFGLPPAESSRTDIQQVALCF
jgi:hypothetical protein